MQVGGQELGHAAVRAVKHYPLAADIEYAVAGQPLAGGISTGAGGIRPPSYHVIRTAANGRVRGSGSR